MQWLPYPGPLFFLETDPPFSGSISLPHGPNYEALIAWSLLRDPEKTLRQAIRIHSQGFFF